MWPHSDDLLNATTKQKVVTVAPCPSLCSYKLLSKALTCEKPGEKNTFVIAFLHHSLSDMPAPVKLFEQNDSQDRPVFWSWLSWLSEIPSQTERSKKAKLCVEAQQKSCLNLVIFHISLAYTANNQRSKTAAGLQTLSFSSLLPQATSANWIFFGNSTRMKLALIHNITVFVCNGDKCIPDSFIKLQTMIFEFCRVQRG